MNRLSYFAAARADARRSSMLTAEALRAPSQTPAAAEPTQPAIARRQPTRPPVVRRATPTTRRRALTDAEIRAGIERENARRAARTAQLAPRAKRQTAAVGVRKASLDRPAARSGAATAGQAGYERGYAAVIRRHGYEQGHAHAAEDLAAPAPRAAMRGTGSALLAAAQALGALTARLPGAKAAPLVRSSEPIARGLSGLRRRVSAHGTRAAIATAL